jgi:hypothetical protein
LDKIQDYKRKWIQHANWIPCNRLPRLIKELHQKGKRNQERPLKSLLDVWDQKGSTGGSTLWWLHDDDEVQHTDITFMFWTLTSVNIKKEFTILKLSNSINFHLISKVTSCYKNVEASIVKYVLSHSFYSVAEFTSTNNSQLP